MMKKLLALLLVLSMVLVCSVALVSCNQPKDDDDDEQNDAAKEEENKKVVTAADFDEDATKALGIALSNAMAQFFGDGAKAEKVLESALNGGSAQITFESDSLLGDVTKISETLYMNANDKKAVSDTVVTYDGEDYSGRVFVTEKGLMFNSASVLGSDKTLALNVDTFFDSFASSAAAEYVFGGEVPEELDEILAEVKSIYDALLQESENNEEFSKKFQQIHVDFDMAVTEEGDNIVVSYTFSNKTIQKAAYDIVDIAFDEMENNAALKAVLYEVIAVSGASIDEMRDELTAELDDVFADMDESVKINLASKVTIAKETSAIVAAELTGDCSNPKPEADDEITKFDVDLQLAFGAEEIAIKLDVVTDNVDETALGGELKVAKTDAKDTLTYDATVTAYYVEDGVEELNDEVLNATFTYDKASGDFELSAQAGVEDETVTFGLTGNYKVDEKTISLAINSVTANAYSVNFDLNIVVKAKDAMPETPGNALDVVALNKAQIEEIEAEIENSPLLKLIDKIESSRPTPDYSYPEYDYEEDYDYNYGYDYEDDYAA